MSRTNESGLGSKAMRGSIGGIEVKPGAWDNLIVVVGASWWDGTPLLERHVAMELAHYAPVLFVDPPVSLMSKFRSIDARTVAAKPGLRQVHDRIAVLSVRVPPLMERPVVKHISLIMTRRAIRRAVQQLGSDRAHAMIVPNLEPLFGCAGERVKVLYVKDDYLAGARLTGLPAGRLRRLFDRLPREADVVVTVSELLADRIRALGVEPVLIPNGVDVEVFSNSGIPPSSLEHRPTAAFVGHLSDRVDVDLLVSVAESGVPLRIIGPPQETMTAGLFARLQGNPNVECIGRVPYEKLGLALANITTCLLPYGDTDFNRASFPLKILEYLAAGRRVVSTDLPAVQWLGTDLVERAKSPEEFIEAVRRSLSRPLEEEEVAQRREFAARHSWTSRTAVLTQRLGLGGQHSQVAVARGLET